MNRDVAMFALSLTPVGVLMGIVEFAAAPSLLGGLGVAADTLPGTRLAKAATKVVSKVGKGAGAIASKIRQKVSLGMSKGDCPPRQGLTPYNADFVDEIRNDGVPVISNPNFLNDEKYDPIRKIIFVGDRSPHARVVHEYIHVIQDRLGMIPSGIRTKLQDWALEFDNFQRARRGNFGLNSADLDHLFDAAASYLPNRAYEFQKNPRRRF